VYLEFDAMNPRQRVALAALEYVKDGMILGLGTGNTTSYFIDALGEKLGLGELRDIRGVPTSVKSAEQARRLGIPLVSLADVQMLDLAVDGADEVDPERQLIKGLGRALLREKIVETHTRQFVVIVDEAKLSPRLGVKQPLPVEIVQFEAALHIRWLNSLGCRAEQWLEDDGRPVITDNGNFLARCWFDQGAQPGIADYNALARELAYHPGVVEHGMFLNMADAVLVGTQDGVKQVGRD
jgi:ribose 5-phosphate isomerase A